MLLGALCPAHRVNVRDRLGRRLPDELKAPSTLCSFQLEGVHRPIRSWGEARQPPGGHAMDVMRGMCFRRDPR